MSNQIYRVVFLKIIFLLFFISQGITYASADFQVPIEVPIYECGDPLDVTHQVDNYNEKTEKVRHHLHLVQKAHYTMYLPLLNKVSNTPNEIRNLLHNFDYTLRHFPNHHGALYIMAKLQKRLGGELPQRQFADSWHRSMECYFDRAKRYQPNDAKVFLIFGIYLHSVKKYGQALSAYKIAEKLDSDLIELQYNMGLLYFDKKKYKLSKQYAKKAYAQGFSLKGLKNKLLKVKMWP